MSHILLNYAFLLFWSSFGEIHSELLFLDIKVTISETSTEIVWKFFSNHVWKGQILRNIWICLNNFFFNQTSQKGININKNCFSPQSEPHTAKLCLSVVLKQFWGNSMWTFFFWHKSDYLINEHWNSPKVWFSNHVWKGQILRNIWICLNNFFLIKQVGILTKTVFLHKVSHILLNYVFLLFWSSFGEIHSKLLFLEIKVTTSETSTEIVRMFVFLTMYERGKYWGVFGFV